MSFHKKILVRLLTETWVEISDNLTSIIFFSRSSPCGDVSWNKLHVLLRILSKVRLLAETWIEIHTRAPSALYSLFVSLRRRELKLLADNTDRSIKCSSPCGDVSWNNDCKKKAGADLCSSPYGDVSWNNLATGGAVKTACSSPYGDVNWNIVAVKKKTCHSVRLLTETWVEILLQIKDLCATISSSPYGDVSWNIFCFLIFSNVFLVRLLTETWVEIGSQSVNRMYNKFVSLRRRELKCRKYT